MALFTIKLDLEKVYIDYINEIIRLLTIFAVVYFINQLSSSKDMFEAAPTDLLVYYGLGITFYCLVINKFVSFQ